MGRTTRAALPLYLDHDKAALLALLSEKTRIPKSVLLREAVDDLLLKHKMLTAPKAKVNS